MVAVGKEELGSLYGHVHNVIFKTDNQQGPTVEPGNSAQCSVVA